ncbi:MAG: hypothetical protein AB7V56_17320 [Candidatus Nitrosocosmicus sp.]|uniref:hypothetical protein n=1 Tax=Candidatus Nitrosocosmicus agrestis TaxID=2563600 RepID=UPI0012B6729B|nr:hypothetical protein [Candidatus Nitrosocosmicus sp. SS]MDR4492482.1 hypothetical protein [Candidatus Nitrosocosmicus sp.]
MLQGPTVNVPTTVKKFKQWKVSKITADPESVDYHFRNSPVISGIGVNPEFMTSHNST